MTSTQLSDILVKIHAASPYLPQQYGYADFVPSQAYYAFASAAGCFGPPALPRGNISTSVFQCLVNKDTETLQKANSLMVSLSRYAIVVFLPVTDGALVQQLPSQQLFQKKLNGVNLLIGVCLDFGSCLRHYETPWLTLFYRIMLTKALHSPHKT